MRLTDEQRQMVEDNVYLARFAAGKYFKLTDLEFDDVVGLCNLALVQAAQTFNPELGFKFSGYAMKMMWGKIMNQQKRRASVNAIYFEDLSPESDGTWAEFIADSKSMESEIITDIMIDTLLNKITNDPNIAPRAKDIIRIHVLNPHLTQQQIAQLTNCTHANVRYTYKSLRKRYREELAM